MQFVSLTSTWGCSTTLSLDGLSTILYRHSSVLLRLTLGKVLQETFTNAHYSLPILIKSILCPGHLVTIPGTQTLVVSFCQMFK